MSVSDPEEASMGTGCCALSAAGLIGAIGGPLARHAAVTMLLDGCSIQGNQQTDSMACYAILLPSALRAHPGSRLHAAAHCCNNGRSDASTQHASRNMAACANAQELQQAHAGMSAARRHGMLCRVSSGQGWHHCYRHLTGSISNASMEHKAMQDCVWLLSLLLAHHILSHRGLRKVSLYKQPMLVQQVAGRGLWPH